MRVNSFDTGQWIDSGLTNFETPNKTCLAEKCRGGNAKLPLAQLEGASQQTEERSSG